jgi:hypothetical protein
VTDPDGCVITREGQRAFAPTRVIGFLVISSPGNPESGDVVGTLITRQHEPPGGIDDDDSWIVPKRGSVAYLSKLAISADSENADGIAQTVYPVDEPAVGRNADFRGENSAWNPGGRLETCCMSVSLPSAGLNRQKMIVSPSSCIEYIQTPFG